MRGEQTRRKRAERGFSLIEVMIAMTVFAVGMITLSAVQVQAMRSGSSSRHATQAAAIAKSQMEQLQRLAWAQIGPTAGWTAAVQRNNTVQGSPNMVEAVYFVDLRITNLIAGWTRAIDVRVQWSDPKRPNRSVVISGVRFNRRAI